MKSKHYYIFFSLLFLSCKLEDSSILEIEFVNLKSSNPTISPKSINLDSLLINGQKQASDTLTVTFNSKLKVNSLSAIVQCKIPVGRITYSVNLKNDGISPDLNKLDSIYSGNVEVRIPRSFYGNLFANYSVSENNFNGDSHILPISITRSNLPPSISNLSMSDSVKLSTVTQILPIYLVATDPDGLSDIQKVEFASYRMPDSVTVRSRFEMYDDGGKNNVSGNTDSKANDGIYTLSVQLPPSTTTGTFLFVFQATDKSGATSNTIKKTILIK